MNDYHLSVKEHRGQAAGNLVAGANRLYSPGGRMPVSAQGKL